MTDLTTATVEVPILDEIMNIHGQLDYEYIKPGIGIANMYEENDDARASFITVEGFHLTGTKASHLDTFEVVANRDFATTQSAALYLESLHHVAIRHLTISDVRGNGMMLYGGSEGVELSNNHIYNAGIQGLLVLPKTSVQLNAHHVPTLTKLLFSVGANVSFNRVHHIGLTATNVAGITLFASGTTLVDNFLSFPAFLLKHP